MMGPWARRSLSLVFSVVYVSLSRSAAAPWSNSSGVGSSSSLETILHNAGREVPQLPSLPAPANTGTDIFTIGTWLAGPLSLASHQLANYPLDGLRSPLAGTAEFSRRLRPQFPVDLAAIDRSQQWLSAVPGAGVAAAGAVGSTAQQQRQQPQQEREMAAAATKLASSLSNIRVSPSPREQQAIETLALSLQALRIASNRCNMKDSDRATINHLTAAAAKSVDEMERFFHAQEDLLVHLGNLGKALQSLKAPWEYTASAPLALAGADLHAAASTATIAIDPVEDHQEQPRTTTTTTTTTTTSTTTTATTTTATTTEAEVTTTTPTAAAIRATSATTSARITRNRTRRGSGMPQEIATEDNIINNTHNNSTNTGIISTTSTMNLSSETTQADLMQEQQQQHLQLLQQQQQELQHQQEQQQLFLQQQQQDQQQQNLLQHPHQHQVAEDEAAAMARLRALLRSNTYADLRAALGPQGTPVTLREALAFKEFGDKLKQKGWGATEIRKAAKKTNNTTEAFYTVAKEVGLSRASVDALAPRMPTLLK